MKGGDNTGNPDIVTRCGGWAGDGRELILTRCVAKAESTPYPIT